VLTTAFQMFITLLNCLLFIGSRLLLRIKMLIMLSNWFFMRQFYLLLI